LQTIIDAGGDNAKPLGITYTKAEILSVLLAGADTTGTALLAMVAYIIGKPTVCEKIIAGIDEHTRKGNLIEVSNYDKVVRHYPRAASDSRKQWLRLEKRIVNI
jgi:cytochrome P450